MPLSPKETSLKETAPVVEHAKPTMRIKVPDKAFLKPRNSNGPVCPTRKCKSRILTVQVFVKSDSFAAVAVVGGDFGWKIRIAEERYELALDNQFPQACFLKRCNVLTCPSLSMSHILHPPRIPNMSAYR
jgi:hypothetical protein